jgi:hypothetical protein
MADYDRNNIFARILRGEAAVQEGLRGRSRARLPRHQSAGAGARAGDPKGEYVSNMDFSAQRADRDIAGFWRAVGTVARQLGWSRTAIAWSPTTAPMAARSCSISTSIS